MASRARRWALELRGPGNKFRAGPRSSRGVRSACRMACWLVLAQVCASAGYLRFTSGRTAWKPLGNSQLPYVHAANVMVTRVVMMIKVFEARGCFW
eukprot:12765937-Alexandrium_andersonii.AAC.1